MKKILIVDDHSAIVDLVKDRLEANHYIVVTAGDGNLAIKVAKEQKPNLIIMDIMMPNLSGGDAVKLLKSDLETKHIPVIFLTAVMSNLPSSGEEKSVNVDGQFYTAISKPFKAEKLLFEIRRVLGE